MVKEKCEVHKLKLKLKKCDSQDILLYVEQKTKNGLETIPICRKCWKKLANKDEFYEKGGTI